MDHYLQCYKVVLVGDAQVGKTHICSRYVKGTLPKNATATIGVEFSCRTVPLQSGGTVKAQIWDTAGQERYRAITSAHYKRAVAAVLVYDLTNEESFHSIPRWLEDIRENSEPDCVVMLVGNKLDVVEDNADLRQIPKKAAMAFANRNNIFFSETSAVKDVNVGHVFEFLMQEVFNCRTRKAAQEQLVEKERAGGVSVKQAKSTYEWTNTGGIVLREDAKTAQARQANNCCT